MRLHCALVLSAPRLRPAARAVVMDAAQRVLLVHFVLGTVEELPNGLWACPGGGIEPHESLTDGLRRELQEELGLVVADVGQPIWHKEHVFPMDGGWDGQRDTFFLVEVNSFEPCPELSVAELRAENVDAMRWWTMPELRAAQAAYDTAPRSPATETFSPRRLAHLLTHLLATGRPSEALQLDPL
jgi:8-oxo-dGTP pyrophosphatase MutT (NUDIX family)